MSERVLQPIQHRDAYTRAVEREVAAYFEEAIFAPLFVILRDAGVSTDPAFQAIKFDEFGRRENSFLIRLNAGTAIERAIREGRINYADGVFSGRFSSATSKELLAAGAKFDREAKVFKIDPAAVPLELRGILATAAANTAAVNVAVLGTLEAIAENVPLARALLASVTDTLEKIEGDLGRQLVETASSMTPRGVALAPTIDPATRARLRAEFTENLDLGIKGFAAERIPELRRRVEENALQFGGRVDRLAKIIEAEFGVAKRKAEFLADQETGLLVSKYRAVKYGELGIDDYIWSTSHDARVRPSHRVLDGKRFSFSRGALVSDPGQPARYLNPGEDWRCRCVPRPLVNLAAIAER